VLFRSTITSAKGTVPGGGVARPITDQDVKALQNRAAGPHIASVTPSMTGSVTATVGQIVERASMLGATENYLRIVDRSVVAGTWFSRTEVRGNVKNVVIGEDAVTLLWGPGTNLSKVIGAKVRINRTPFRVEGVLAPDGQNDNLAIVPFGTSRAYLVGKQSDQVSQVIVKSTSADDVGPATDEINKVLDQQHFVKKAADRDYNVRSFANLLASRTQFITFLTLFTAAVAAISLIVGGIGVANIMLVAVTERTREIGIRKAIGAPRRAILKQFLTEAVVLTSLGGLIGVVFGLALAIGSGLVVPKFVPSFPTPVLTVAPVLLAFGVSILIGLVAGGYPANRAARLRPIEALRFE
jgi:putative ABC transport system permease protein